jgi:hypothetical protein
MACFRLWVSRPLHKLSVRFHRNEIPHHSYDRHKGPEHILLKLVFLFQNSRQAG